MVQSRMACALIGAALSALVLTGCQDGEAGAAQTPSGTSSASTSAPESSPAAPTPTPSPASAAGPAVNIPVPEKPELADENSVEGLEAFTRWWFELLNYAYATNDLEPLKAVTDEGCTTCQNISGSIQEAFIDGGWIAGGNIQLESFDSNFESNVHRSISSFITITQDSAIYYSVDGLMINETPGFSEPDLNELIAFYEDGEWLLLDVGAVNVEDQDG